MTDFLDDSINHMLPCVLLLDVSLSMQTQIASGFSRIDALNEGVKVFQREIQDDDYATEHVDVSLMTFGSSVDIVQDWIVAKNFIAPTLKTHGSTPLAEAFINAIDLCEQRKRFYINHQIERYRPWIIIISDGQPTSSPDIWQRATTLASQVRDKRKAFVTCVAIDGCPTSSLKQLSSAPEFTFELSSHSFREFFHWISSSLGEFSRSGESLEQDFVKPSFFK